MRKRHVIELFFAVAMTASQIPCVATAYDASYSDSFWSDCGTCDDCRVCDCSGCPVWTVNAAVVALHRNHPAGNVLFNNAVQPGQEMRGSDFDFSYRAGIDLSVKRHFSRLPAIEVRYLKNDGWHSGAGLVTNTADALRINTADPIFLNSGRTINASYGSRLDNLEVNASWGRECFTWLAGFRYIELDDTFRADLVDAVISNPTVTFDTTTQNRLYGFQLGVEAFLWQRGRLSVDATAKGAILHNSGAQTSRLGTPAFQTPAFGSKDHVSLLGEANLIVRYSLLDSMWIRAGYGVLLVDDLALATDQMNATSFATGQGIDIDGTVFYHGAFLGLECVY